MTTKPSDMKPSERIHELAEKSAERNRETFPLAKMSAWIDGITDYLDEQHAAGQGEEPWWGVWCERPGSGFWRTADADPRLPLRTTRAEAERRAANLNESQLTRTDSVGWHYEARRHAAPVAARPELKHTCGLASHIREGHTTGADCPRCRVLGIDGFTVDPVAAPPAHQAPAADLAQPDPNGHRWVGGDSSCGDDGACPGYNKKAAEPAAPLHPFGGTCTCRHASDHSLAHERGCVGYRETAANNPISLGNVWAGETNAAVPVAGERVTEAQIEAALAQGKAEADAFDAARRGQPCSGIAAPLPSNPVEPETTRGQIQWGLDCVAGALGRPALLVGEHAGAVSKVMSERDAANELLAAIREMFTSRGWSEYAVQGVNLSGAVLSCLQSVSANREALTTATARIKELTRELELAKPPPPFTANSATLRADCPTPGCWFHAGHIGRCSNDESKPPVQPSELDVARREVKRLECELNSKQIHYAQLLMQVERLEDSNAQLHRENDGGACSGG